MDPDDILYVPRPKRLVQSASEDGALVLLYEDKEITFDEPELVAIGLGLLERRSFRASEAGAWSDEHPMAWEEAREVLGALVDAGILACAEGGVVPRIAAPHFEERATTAAPGVAPVAPDPTRTFARSPDRTAELGAEIFDVALDATLLECFVPVFRVAHAAFDEEGRQLGEASVRYDALLQPLPTSWVACSYAGSRFHAGLMNVTALRAASKRWTETLGVVDAVRRLYLERRGLGPGPLSAMDVYGCATAILALPAWLLMRPDAPLASGAIPATVAHAFRVVDGVRFVSESMMQGAGHLPAPIAPSDVFGADAFVGYAEEHGFLFGRHGGVCAGPATMIHALADLVIRGERPAALRAQDPALELAALEELLGDVDGFLRYAMAGIGAYLTGNLHQHRQLALLHELRSLAEARLAAGLAGALERYEGLFAPEPVVTPWSASTSSALCPELAPPLAETGEGAPAELVELLRPSVSAASLGPLSAILTRALRGERAHLRAMEHVQALVGEPLGRPRPTRSLTYADLPAASEWQLPMAVDVVLEALGGSFDRRSEELRLGGSTFASGLLGA